MATDDYLLFVFSFFNFNRKFAAMKNALRQVSLVLTLVLCLMVLASWTGGPAPECKNDSLAIVRVVKPMYELFNIKPVVFVSKGAGKIDEVKVSDADLGNGDIVLKQTLTDFLSNGYTIQTATESVDEGMKLNTYYLKKKVI